LTILAVMLGFLAIVPGLPTMPFLIMAAAVGLLSHSIHKNGMPEFTPAGAGIPSMNGGMNGKPADPKAPATAGGSATAAEAKANDKLENLLALDTLQIELGYNLVAMADGKKGGSSSRRTWGCWCRRSVCAIICNWRTMNIALF
jgi:flagellar biosynthesis protein FlhA